MIYYLIQRLNNHWHLDLRTGLGRIVLFFIGLEATLMVLLGLSLLIGE